MSKKTNTKTIEPTITNEVEVKQSLTDRHDLNELVKTHTTKSSMIRYLASKDEKMGDIARALSVVYGKPMRFQHVRNVLTKVKKA